MTRSAKRPQWNLSSMVGWGRTATIPLVLRAEHYLPGVGKLSDGLGCCKLLGNNLLELL